MTTQQLAKFDTPDKCRQRLDVLEQKKFTKGQRGNGEQRRERRELKEKLRALENPEFI